MSALTDLFTALANKIRSKTGGSATYTPPQMVNAIDDVYDAGVAAGTTPTQTKTVTAGTSATTVTPDQGYALSSVTVNPTPSETKTQAAGTSNIDVTPTSGKLLSKVTITPLSHTGTYTPVANTAANDMGANHDKRYVNTSGMIVPSGNKSITANGTNIDVSSYATASVSVPAPTHTGTYTPAANTSANDMGASHTYRYVNTSGMVVPSGTYSAGEYTTNGTKTISGLSSYAAVTFDINIPASSTTTGSHSNSDTGTVSSKTQTFNAAKTGYKLIGAGLKKAQVYSAYANDNTVNWQASVSVSGNTITLTMKSNNTRTFRCQASYCQITAFYVAE